MRLLGIFVSIAVLLGLAVAQADLADILAQIPLCTQTCSLKILTPAHCQLTDLHNCLCTNTTLQHELALCVLGSCNITEQVVSLTVTQNEICQGVPQPSRSEEIIRAVIIIAAVTSPIVLLRFWSRGIVSQRFSWDDLVIVIAALIMIPMVVIPIYNAKRGFGKHFWNVPPENITILRLLYYVSQILYVLVQNLAKFSILLLYLRIFTNKRFRLITIICIGFMLCHILTFLMAVSLQCVPVKTVWDPTVNGKCINSLALVYAGAGLSIFEDIVIMLLPIAELKDLNLDLRKRVALVFIFALGSFACVTSMVRLKYIVSYGNSLDQTFDNVDVVIWSVIETFTAMICACLMTLRPLIVKYLPSILPASKLSASRSKGYGNPSWGQNISSKLSNKLRTGNSGVELLSEDEETKTGGGGQKGIVVSKSWVTESNTTVAPDNIELPKRNPTVQSARNFSYNHAQ